MARAMFAATEGDAVKNDVGIDLAGGTILVYEVNVERTKELNQAAKGDGGAAAKVASPT